MLGDTTTYNRVINEGISISSLTIVCISNSVWNFKALQTHSDQN
jgi:hypothetical protein